MGEHITITPLQHLSCEIRSGPGAIKTDHAPDSTRSTVGSPLEASEFAILIT